MLLQVNSLAGSLVPDFEADEAWTVRATVIALIAKTALKVGSTYRLCLGGEILRPSRSLKESGVVDGSTLLAVVIPCEYEKHLRNFKDNVAANNVTASIDDLFALQKLGQEAAPLVEDVAICAKMECGPALRWHLVRTLGSLGPDALPELTMFFYHKQFNIRDEARRAALALATDEDLEKIRKLLPLPPPAHQTPRPQPPRTAAAAAHQKPQLLPPQCPMASQLACALRALFPLHT